MQRGERITKRCAFGYRKENGNLVPDEGTTPTVKRIFQLALQGYSTGKIAALLTQDSCPTPGEQKGEIATLCPCIWSHGVIRRILTDQQYAGTYVAGKTKTETMGGRRIPVPESQWIIIPDHHPAIITAEDFAQVQERFKSKPKAKSQPTADNATPTTPIQGLVYCGHCGHKMRHSRGKIPSYWCHHTGNAPHAPCHKASIPVKDLETQVFEALKAHAKTLAIPGDVPKTHGIIGTKTALYEAFLEGEIDENTYKSKIKHLQNQKTTQKRHSTPNLVQSVLAVKILTPDLVKSCIEKIFFKQNSELFIHWKPEFSAET